MMTTSDSRQMGQRESEECYPYECDACATESVIKEATVFCYACMEHLCLNCESWHRKLKATRYHKVHPLSEAEWTLPGSRIDIKCYASNPLKIICNYGELRGTPHLCMNHEKPISPCKPVRHKQCKTSVSEDLNRPSSQLFNEMVDKANKLSRKSTQIQIKHAIFAKGIDESEKHFRKEIKYFRSALNQWVDKLEDNTIVELEYRVKNISDILKQHETTMSNIRQFLREIIGATEQLQNDGHRLDTSNQIQKLLESYEQTLLVIEENIKSEFTFQLNPDICRLHKQLDCLGQFDMEGPMKSAFGRTTFLRANVSMVTSIQVKQPDKIRCNIVDVVFTVDGDVLAADARNNKLFLMDGRTMKVINSIVYPQLFFLLTLAPIDTETCVSLVPGQQKIEFILVKPKLKIHQTLKLTKTCHAMTTQNHVIYLACNSDEPRCLLDVMMMDDKGVLQKLVRSVDMEMVLESRASYNIGVSSDGQKIFFTQKIYSAATRVLCMTTTGKYVYSYTDKCMKGSRGIIVDEENNALVCVEKSNDLLVINSDGTKHTLLLTSDSGVCRPNCIAYRFSDGMLVVGDSGESGVGDMLCMFKLS